MLSPGAKYPSPPSPPAETSPCDGDPLCDTPDCERKQQQKNAYESANKNASLCATREWEARAKLFQFVSSKAQPQHPPLPPPPNIQHKNKPKYTRYLHGNVVVEGRAGHTFLFHGVQEGQRKLPVARLSTSPHRVTVAPAVGCNFCLWRSCIENNVGSKEGSTQS